jgi:hypothetical protein
MSTEPQRTCPSCGNEFSGGRRLLVMSAAARSASRLLKAIAHSVTTWLGVFMKEEVLRRSGQSRGRRRVGAHISYLCFTLREPRGR